MALTGKMPFDAGSALALATIYKKKLTNDITPPRQLTPSVSERVDKAICQALRANPKERPASVQQFLDELAPQAVAELDIQVTPLRSRRRKTLDEQERRRLTRFAVKLGVRCHTSERSPEARWQGETVNVSQVGFCMELNRSFQPGTMLNVRLGKKKVGGRSILVRVMWVKKLAADRWRMGCKFDQVLSEEEVLEFQ
jgi:hypothetical protein